MLGEVIAAAVVGALVLWLLLQPLIRPSVPHAAAAEPIDPEETPKGIALAALKEIEFDRETGKLSDSDYQSLKTKYTAEALTAMRHDPEPAATDRGSDDLETMIAAKVRALRSASASKSSDASASSPSSGPACAGCGPRPEPAAVYCSSCGRRLPVRIMCDRCGTTLVPGSKYCESCGRQVAA
jgi:double zinc ribbon protein